jgi:hypothetical protein
MRNEIQKRIVLFAESVNELVASSDTETKKTRDQGGNTMPKARHSNLIWSWILAILLKFESF